MATAHAIQLAERLRKHVKSQSRAAIGGQLAGEVLREREQARCEGYVNYATSSVAIMLENDRLWAAELHEYVRSAHRMAPGHEAVADGTWTVAEARRFLLADSLKGWVEELMERGVKDGDAGLPAAALARAGFGEVDWDDLARVELARAEEEA